MVRRAPIAGQVRTPVESDASLELSAELPVVSERIGESTGAPAVLVVYGCDEGGSRGDRPVEQGGRIPDGQDHSDGAQTRRGRTRVGIVLDPELRSVDRQTRDGAPSVVIVEPVRIDGAERGSVESHRLLGVANGQPRRDGGVEGLGAGHAHATSSQARRYRASRKTYHTSPGRQSQLIGAERSSSGDVGVRRTKTFPSSSAVRTSPAAVRTEVGPSHTTHPIRSS